MGALNITIMEPKIQNKSSVTKPTSDCAESIKICESHLQMLRDEEDTEITKSSEVIIKNSDTMSETKIQLSFSVDRLLNREESAISKESLSVDTDFEKCCQQPSFPCCTNPNCLLNISKGGVLTKPYQISSLIASQTISKFHQVNAIHSPTISLTDYANKCIVRPLAMRAMGTNNCDDVSHCLPFPTLFRLHQEQQKPLFPHPQSFSFASRTPATNIALSPMLVTPLGCNQKSLQLGIQLGTSQSDQQVRQTLMSSNHFPKPKLQTSPTLAAGHYHSTLHQMHHPHSSQQQHQHQHQHQPILTHFQLGNNTSAMPTTQNINININNDDSHNNGNGQHNNNNNNQSNNSKRKRSWSRAVFSNLQRKGLEIQFQQQKYITKPDRRKLAARLNLTDAQVKVWFQNRRMKWRHTRENLKSGQEKQPTTVNSQESSQSQLQSFGDIRNELGYSSDGSDCSMVIDDNEDDGGDIDVVE